MQIKRFRELQSVHKSYRQQGEIFFCCLNYAHQTRQTREKIDRLCEQAAGEHAAALKHYLTTEVSWQEVTAEYHLSDKTLERVRNRFYRLWR